MKSLQIKILALILSAMIILASLVGITCVISTRYLLKRDANTMLNTTSEVQKVQLNILLKNIKQSVEIVETCSIYEADSIEALQNDDVFRKEYTDHIFRLFTNVTNHTPNALSYYFRYNPEFFSPTEGFFRSKENGSSDFEFVEPTNLNMYEPNDDKNVGWYFIPAKKGSPAWIMPHQNRDSDYYLLSYVIPLYIGDKLLGVAGMDVDFEDIMKSVDSIIVYNTGYAYLTDSNNRIVYHKHFDPGSKCPDNLDKEMIECKTTLDNGMNLVITVKKSEVYKDLNSVTLRVIILCSLVSILFIFLTLLITRRLIKPLGDLTVATEQMMKNNYEFNYSSNSNDEIGILARTLEATSAQIRSQMSHITGLAYSDALTGVKNSTAYKEKIKELDEEIQNSDPQFAVMVLDVNNLKKTNDNYGHKAGDALIISSCKLICRIFTHSPVYRIGGDEFVVLLRNDDYKNRETLITKFDNAMKTAKVKTENEQLQISIAKGIAVFRKEKFDSYQEVFKQADKRMYENKSEMKKSFPQ
ncbi:MAG: diguanylate cyclase [Oscillospiraceae bacterium]|nr:diguanylate cyclase [Oscillospiraceae bacterium]